MDSIQTVVVGAGIIGIAVARKLARAGHEVLILEAEERIAQHTSSRNSQVIHAGIYYEQNSWRAQLCVTGKQMLYEYCTDRHVPFENTQKLIVAATDQDTAKIPKLITNAAANGVDDLVQLTAADAIALEPELACKGAILSPSTGIVDVPAFILSLLGEAEAEGAFVALGSPLQKVVPQDDGYVLSIGDADQTRLKCRTLINAAGLGAWDVARSIEGYASAHIPPQYFAKGSWFSMTGPAPFQHLIYPVPADESLGVHYTQAFEASVRRWWPALPKGALHPDGCGIRPRISRDPNRQSDFVFLGPTDHGHAGLVHLFGMESPGVTSALAIASVVAKMAK